MGSCVRGSEVVSATAAVLPAVMQRGGSFEQTCFGCSGLGEAASVFGLERGQPVRVLRLLHVFLLRLLVLIR